MVKDQAICPFMKKIRERSGARCITCSEAGNVLNAVYILLTFYCNVDISML